MKKVSFNTFAVGITILLFLACGSDSEAPTPSLSSSSEILEFTVLGASGIINRMTNEISAIVSENSDITALAPEIMVSPGATISPASGSTQDFTEPITYTVTAEDGSTEIFTISVATEIFPFTIDGKRYELVRIEMFWPDAAAFAVARGGHLAEVNSAMEQVMINAALGDANIVLSTLSSVSEVWLGGSDINEDGTWIWDGDNDGIGPQFWSGGADGMAVDDLYNNWGNIEPDGEEVQNALTILLANSPFNGASQWNDRAEEFQTLFSVIEFED